MKNESRIFGDNICIGTKDGVIKYFSWKQNKMITDKDQATGYHNKPTAKDVINQLKTQFPGYTWITKLDKSKDK